MNKVIVDESKVTGKKVLLRCDFNVPYDENGEISDTRRIDESLKTINFLVKNNAKVIICSHFRRPHGVVDSSMSLIKAAKYLSSKIGQEVKLAKDVVGESAKSIVSNLSNGEV